MRVRWSLAAGGLLAVVAVAGVLGVLGVHRHRAHVASLQLADAQRVAHAVSVRGADPTLTCPDSPTVACLGTSLSVRAATGEVAASMNSAAHVEPRIRCFVTPSTVDPVATRSRWCIVDLAFGPHIAFVTIHPAARIHPGVKGSMVSVNVS